MKKILVLLLSVVMMLALVSCSQEDGLFSKKNKDQGTKVEDEDKNNLDDDADQDKNSPDDNEDEGLVDQDEDDTDIDSIEQIADGKFTSAKYGYVINIPEKWDVYDRADASKFILMSAGVAEEDVASNAKILENQGVTYELFANSIETVNETGGVNNIIIQAVDIKKIDNMSADELLSITLETTKSQFSSMGAEITAETEIEEFKTIGFDGYFGEMSYAIAGIELSQQYFIFQADTHYILFVGTCATDSFKESMMDVIDNISKAD